MRVLYTSHTGRVSGGELSLLGLLEALPAGTEAAVACPPGELARLLGERGVEVLPIRGTDGSLRLDPRRTPRALAEMALAAAGVRRAARRFGADLLHANSIRAGVVSIAPARLARRPLVVHVRDCLPPGPVSALTLRTISRAEVLIANSAHTRAGLGPAAAAARVVHNGIDLSRFPAPGLSAAAARARLGLGGGGPVLAVIAQVTPWKGQDDAIRIAAGLGRRFPELRLLLVGSLRFDSPSTRYDNAAFLAGLHRQVDELGLAGRVEFLGQRDDVPQVLAAVDLLLVPSWEEPFGRAIVEAMAAGVPVAATSVGGPAEILVEGSSGLLLAPRDPGRWVAALEPVLADPARLAELGRGARREAGRFGIDRHAAAVAAVYRAVVSGAPPRPRTALA